MTVSRKSILDYEDTNIGRVEVKEFGGEVCVATLSAEEADQIRKLPEDVPANVSIAILGACDEKGERLFTVADTAALKRKPSKALTTIANAVLKHNGLLAESGDEAKNASSETASDDSASASPSPSEEPSAN